MKNTLKTILAALALTVAIAACTSKPAETTEETTPADTTTAAPVQADTTATATDTTAAPAAH